MTDETDLDDLSDQIARQRAKIETTRAVLDALEKTHSEETIEAAAVSIEGFRADLDRMESDLNRTEARADTDVSIDPAPTGGPDPRGYW
jgi:chromosome segregation ATPase